MRFRILGPLEAQASGGGSVSIPALKQRTLLVVLLLHANRRVSVGRLEHALWAGHPPRSAAGILRTYVSGLRRSLRLGEPDQLPRLAATSGGYQLAVSPGDLDLAVFEDLSSRGLRALEGDSLAEAALLLHEALGLWRGDPAEDVTLDGDEAATVAGLAERRLVTEEAWIESQLALGKGPELIVRLRGLVTAQPLRERPCGQLMVALCRAGRRAEALQAFALLRRRMAHDLGIEPSPALQALQHQILTGHLALGQPARPGVAVLGPPPAAALVPSHAADLGRPAAAGPGHPAAAGIAVQRLVPRQLPPDVTDFTGRSVQLDCLHTAIAAHERANPASPLIVAIAGTAGSGKTALAVHWAHQSAARFPDGQLHVNLRGYGPSQPMEPHDAVRRFLRALGTASEDVPADDEEAAALYRSVLAGRRMLILLDNAVSARQVRPLLPGSGCLVVVTSRSRLPGLVSREGAVRLTIGPLAVPEAVDLLRKILGASRVDAEPAAAAEIAVRCAYLPLALRVAAERAANRPALPLAHLSRDLAAEHELLDVLAADGDDAATIRTVFSWSYRALPPHAARLFRFLGLHPGPDTSLPAAAVLAAISEPVTSRLLEVLAGSHLVEETAPGRFRFHDLLRAYATERVRADESAEECAHAMRRLLTWYLHSAAAAARALVPARRHVPLGPPPAGCTPLLFSGYPQALAWCDAEHANVVAAIRAAAETGHDEIAWKLSVVLASFFELRKPLAEWINSGHIAVAAARRAGDVHGEAWALNNLATPYASLRRFDDSLACLREALRIRQETGDRRGEGATLNNLGRVYGDMGRFHDAIGCFQQALALARESGHRLGEGIALNNVGEAFLALRDPGSALEYHQQALAIVRETQHRQVEALTLSNIGTSYRMLDREADASRSYERAMAVHRQAGDRHGEAAVLRDLGDLWAVTGHTVDARQAWQRALAIFVALGDPQADEMRCRLGGSGAGALPPPGLAPDGHEPAWAAEARPRTAGCPVAFWTLSPAAQGRLPIGPGMVACPRFEVAPHGGPASGAPSGQH